MNGTIDLKEPISHEVDTPTKVSTHDDPGTKIDMPIALLEVQKSSFLELEDNFNIVSENNIRINHSHRKALLLNLGTIEENFHMLPLH